MTKEIAKELNEIKETQVTIIENLIEVNKFLEGIDKYLNVRRKFLEKELNKKWYQL